MVSLSGTAVSRVAAGRFVGAVALLAALLLGCHRAEASCGDWLAGHPRAGGATDAVTTGGVSSAIPVPSETPRGPRCSGPACRGVPVLPVPPRESSPENPPPDPADHAVAAMLLPRDVDGASPPPDDRRPPSVITPVPIRPPRPSSLQA